MPAAINHYKEGLTKAEEFGRIDDMIDCLRGLLKIGKSNNNQLMDEKKIKYYEMELKKLLKIVSRSIFD